MTEFEEDVLVNRLDGVDDVSSVGTVVMMDETEKDAVDEELTE